MKKTLILAFLTVLTLCTTVAPLGILGVSQDFGKFCDDFFSAAMKKYETPGAVFVVVKDGQVVLKRGYGTFGLSDARPIDPDTTQFRVASISKLFTATAIMQLLEQGKVSLNDDVEEYIGFKLRNPFNKPVTIRHLLTHTSGLDGRVIGTFTKRGQPQPSLEEHLKERLPPVVREPGEFFSYSNYGYALLGLVIEKISGQSYENYMDENLLAPLEMRHSTFSQDASLDNLPNSYLGILGRQIEVPFGKLNFPPAGGLLATATDIANFMIAHLQNGHFDKIRVLDEATAKLMHESQFRPQPDLNGATFGFDEGGLNSHKVLSHTGGIPSFSSCMYLVPNQNLGFFASFTNGTNPDITAELAYAFFDFLYPGGKQLPSLSSNALSSKEARKFEGYYMGLWFPQSNIEKVTTLTDYYRIRVENGMLVLPNGTRWVQTKPLYFECLEKEASIAFGQDKQGNITHMFTGWATFRKLKWHETSLFWAILLGFCVIVFLSVLVWPAIALWCAMKKIRFSRPVLPFWLAGSCALLNIVFLLRMVFMVSLDPLSLLYGVSVSGYINFSLPILTTFLFIFILYYAINAHIKHFWPISIRIHYLIVTFALFMFIIFLLYMNLIGYNF